DLGHARDQDIGAVDQLDIAPIPGGTQGIDVGRRNAALAREVPGAPPLAQEQVDVGGGVEIDPDARQGFLIRSKVEVLGVNENPVVVEQDRVEHGPLRKQQELPEHADVADQIDP